ncbi:ROK family protein [Hoeflea poritis]|uniref:ROK family protein n=1 Tax=Hoeflea poritis TaxID=2993659 RepID=A0ABT4VTH3_9HYPH|nr:ROK family protein [Hoeflea poritis]MDA4847991.1 ROK family protein [Hoeflea poritis]
MSKIYCLDIGGSFIKLATGNGDDLQEVEAVATPPEYGAFIDRTADLLAAAGIGPRDRLGVSIAGSIDVDNGSVHAAQLPFLASVDFGSDLGAAIGVRLGTPLKSAIRIENDADCFALAEATFGAGRTFDNVFAIILGTGVGGSQVYRGELIRGFGGSAGEWGHGPFIQKQDPSTPGFVPQFACACGQKGCINTMGGARGLEAMHAAAGNPLRDSKAIIDGWAGGDTACTATVASYVSLLTDALAVTLNITGAEIVPVGGGLSSATALISAIDSGVRHKVLRPRPEPLVIRGQTGQNGGLWGIYAQILKDRAAA